MFWYWIVCWFVAAFVALWIWHRLCRLNGCGPDAEAAHAPAQPAQAKPRRPVKYDHVPCPDCGKLRALTAGGTFHQRRHRHRRGSRGGLIAEASVAPAMSSPGTTDGQLGEEPTSAPSEPRAA